MSDVIKKILIGLLFMCLVILLGSSIFIGLGWLMTNVQPIYIITVSLLAFFLWLCYLIGEKILNPFYEED